MSVARTLDVAALGKLQKGFRGQLIVPGDSDYNRSRVDMKGAFLDEPSAAFADRAAEQVAERLGQLLSVRSGLGQLHRAGEVPGS